eukprot:jgi/Tetstr1/423687/TSEL_014321.t1
MLSHSCPPLRPAPPPLATGDARGSRGGGAPAVLARNLAVRASRPAGRQLCGSRLRAARDDTPGGGDENAGKPDEGAAPSEDDWQDAPGAREDLWASGGSDALRLAMQKMRALEAFKGVMADIREGRPVDLWASTMLLAKHRYPDLDEQKYSGILDEWAAAIELRLAGKERYPMVVLKTVAAFMYQDLGFKGNKVDYYHADNSCLNRVLETRTGIPITMSLVFMELARRVGLPCTASTCPATSCCAPPRTSSPSLWTPTTVRSLAHPSLLPQWADNLPEDAEEILGKSWGVHVKLDPVWIRAERALPPGRVLSRVLFNLKNVYSLNQQPAELLTIIQYLRHAAPDNKKEIGTEGIVSVRAGALRGVHRHAGRYLEAEPGAEDASQVREVIREAQKLANQQG